MIDENLSGILFLVLCVKSDTDIRFFILFFIYLLVLDFAMLRFLVFLFALVLICQRLICNIDDQLATIIS